MRVKEQNEQRLVVKVAVRLTIDRSTKTMTVQDRVLLIIPRKRVFPFSDVQLV